MLTIRFQDTEQGRQMTFSGHAGAAGHGKDLVCAAASMLACTAAQSLMALHREGALQTPPRVLLTPGRGEITIQERNARADAVFFTIRTGCSLLAGKYPRYVRLEMNTEERN